MKPSLKWFAVSIGGVVAIAHIGVLGHLIRQESKSKIATVPSINIPHGPYTSFTIKSGKEGYSIEYKANDPAVLESERSLDLDKEKRGLFGGGNEKRTEYRRDQYTMNGTRNIGTGGAAVDGEGKSAQDIECIVADAGARSQGAMAGTAISTGIIAPAVMNIPYIGWLAAGWANLIGQRAGEAAGSQVNSMISDC